MDKLTPRLLVMLLGLAAAGLLGTALVGQYGFDLHPCHLCMYQRYPYAAVIALGAVAFFLHKPKLLLGVAWLAIALFALDGGIATYHAGVELGWFPGPSGCTNSATGEQTLEEMRRAIMEAPLVTCDQAMIQVLGLSMAAWNAIAAFAVTLGSMFLLIKIKNKG